MIWFWDIIIIFLFYLFAILQTSFFIYFNLFGVVPNLVFILFFLIVFFSKKNNYYSTIFFGVLAGILLDIFSVNTLGISVIFLLIIGPVVKKIQSMLKETENNYQPVYFIVLFLCSLLAYNLLSQGLTIKLNSKLLMEIIYSFVIALIGFFICDKFSNKKLKKKQNHF
jgi:rod shape-determining protein MreD